MAITYAKMKIDIGALEVGMHVCELDIPWEKTSYPLQGFTIQSQKDISKLLSQCKHVYIDERFYTERKKPKNLSVSERKSRIQKSFPNKLKTYKDSETWKNEFPKAQKAVEALSSSIKEVFSDFTRFKTLNIVQMKQSVEPMIDSISRNPDACIWLARMKKEDNYIYEHSLSASIWAVALGRQLGLGKGDLKSLAIGALLFDIGKLELDPDLLNAQRKLTKEEFEVIKTHVGHTLVLVKNTKGINKSILSMIEQHHERHNGQGYPQGIQGNDIHVYARIAAIVDCYDAITSNRPYADALPPSEAIKKLYDWRDSEFQSELVEEFIQAIGIYPAGSLVELSSGEVAIVLAEYRARRLRPEVMILLDKNKKAVKDTIIVNLFEKTHTADGDSLDIVKSLEPKAYGINMESIHL